jgi:hypothetical protein
MDGGRRGRAWRFTFVATMLSVQRERRVSDAVEAACQTEVSPSGRRAPTRQENQRRNGQTHVVVVHD